MTCPGSVKLIDALTVVVDVEAHAGDPAEKGNCMHNIADIMLRGGEIRDEHLVWINADGDYEYITDEEISDCIQPYVDLVLKLSEQPGSEMLVEEKVVVLPDLVWGTSDAIIVSDAMLDVVDLKTGYHGVYAKDNPQLKLYALGAHKVHGMMYDYKEVTVHISQGRIRHYDSYTYSVAEIEEFEKEVIQAAAATRLLDKLVPSEHACRWCPVRAHCPALAHSITVATDAEFASMQMAELGEALAKVPMVKAWISGVEDAAKEALEKGHHVPGFKMVEGRKSRKWIDEKQAEAYFKNRINRFQHNCYNMKLKSPAQMEKTLKTKGVTVRGKVEFDKIVVMGGGAPTIVPDVDKRVALVYGDRAASDFAAISQDPEDLLA